MSHRLRADLDHRPVTDTSDVGQDDDLVERIRIEIRERGPMPFARFMNLALYDPAGGYYRSADARPGRGGDFLTAPELDPVFGASVAVAIADIWDRLGRPDRFVVREHGAGEGALAEAMLAAARSMPVGSALRYQPVEIDPRRLDGLRERLTAADLADLTEESDAAQFDGVVLANEVVDALPVHRIRQRAGRMRELAVDLAGDGSFVEVEIEPTTPALAARLAAEGIALVDGQTAEICLALDGWVEAAAAPLRLGVMLLIDYAAVATELYDPTRRRDGTLRAYVRHRVHDDPYRHVGRQDLTAHVDVTAVERAAAAIGLTTLGITTQAEALMGLGIEERLRAIQADPATTIERYTLLRSALMRFLDPAAMGRFAVMAFARDWPVDAGDAPLRLFTYRSPGRRAARS